jgi:NitT/TauT family transport system ATP-binding protein
MVFQEAALFPWRTLLANVSFGLEMRGGLSKIERKERASEALRLVHLSQFADAYPHQLSGGMRQRAALARALVLDPNILLMDEPFGALDAQTRSLLQAELLAIWERTRKTVLFVTHSLDEALFLSDRIVLLSARPGRVVGDYLVDAPRPRDPRTDTALAALRSRLLAQLSHEIETVARAEHDTDWQAEIDAPRTPPEPKAGENIGADI